MRPHPRIRKTIKWGGAAVTVLLGVVVVGGYFAAVMRWEKWEWKPYSRQCAALSQGRLTIVYERPSAEFTSFWWGTRLDVPWDPPRPLVQWWVAYSRNDRFWWVSVPLWMFAVPLVPPGMIWMSRDRRRRRQRRIGSCVRCGYDRTGLASKDAKCPECGAVPASV